MTRRRTWVTNDDKGDRHPALCMRRGGEIRMGSREEESCAHASAPLPCCSLCLDCARPDPHTTDFTTFTSCLEISFLPREGSFESPALNYSPHSTPLLPTISAYLFRWFLFLFIVHLPPQAVSSLMTRTLWSLAHLWVLVPSRGPDTRQMLNR